MRFSICIPNYNYEAYVGRTIQSVLNQTHPDFEIVIADNASTDRSVEIIRGFSDPRLHLRVNAYNVGFAGNLDKAAGMASGDQLILLSSDDLIYPDALAVYQRLYEALGSQAERSLVGSAYDYTDATDTVTGQHSPAKEVRLWGEAKQEPALTARVGLPVFSMLAADLLRACLLALRNPYLPATLAYPRRLYEAVEGYGAGQLYNPDKWFVWKLLGIAEKAYFIDAPLFGYRWHSNNQEALQRQSGALKRLIDQYAATFNLPQEVLQRAQLSHADLAAAFIEEDIALRGFVHLAEGSRALAKRTLRFGEATYPAEAARNRKLTLLRLMLALGPLGQRLAARLQEPALRAYRGAVDVRGPDHSWPRPEALQDRLVRFAFKVARSGA